MYRQLHKNMKTLKKQRSILRRKLRREISLLVGCKVIILGCSSRGAHSWERERNQPWWGLEVRYVNTRTLLEESIFLLEGSPLYEEIKKKYPIRYCHIFWEKRSVVLVINRRKRIYGRTHCVKNHRELIVLEDFFFKAGYEV